jgi:hypothetical protein
VDDGAARKAQTQAVFNRIATEYDVAGPGCFAWFGQRLVDEFGIERGSSVLDVASGRGAVLFPAAERAGPTGSATGIEQYWQNARGTGLRHRLDTLDDEQKERVRTALAERVRDRQRPDGLHLEATALLATATH